MSAMRLLAALLAFGLPAFADVVYLRSGGKVEGRVTDKGDAYQVETADATVTVRKDEVERIEKKPWSPPKGGPLKAGRPKPGDAYSHPFYAFKIILPPKWRRGKTQEPASVSFWGPSETAYQPRLDLIVERDTKDLAEHMARYKEAFRKKFKDVEYPFEGPVTIRGKNGYQFSAAFSEGDPPLSQQSLWTIVVDGDRKYIMSFNCTREWFEKYRADVDASMKSLRIFPEPAAPIEEKKRFIKHYSQAEAAYRAGKLPEALADFEEASRILPDLADVHAMIGVIRMKLNRMAEAEPALRKAVGIDPEDPALRSNLGLCLLKQGKYDDAIAELRKAAEADAPPEGALANLGAAYLAKGLDGPAREALGKAVEADPESAAAHFNLGKACEHLGRPRDAAREFRETLKLDPRHEEARKALERVSNKQ